jgi:hypothetical protein
MNRRVPHEALNPASQGRMDSCGSGAEHQGEASGRDASVLIGLGLATRTISRLRHRLSSGKQTLSERATWHEWKRLAIFGLCGQ